MLTWINDSNKYEEIHKAYFDNYEITIISFSTGGTSAWVKNPGIVSPTIFKKSYPMGMTIEETKEQFLKEFRVYLDERMSYWMDIHYSLWYAENWVEDDE
jgi:hypothetical protein